MPNSAMLARRVFNGEEGYGFDLESGLAAAPARSYFGDIDSYAICSGCGRFHGGSEGGGEGPLGWLNGDDRGLAGPNGKPSLGVVGAGAQITRSNVAWGTLGQPAEVTFAFRANAPGTMPSDTTGFTRFTTAQINIALLSLTGWSDVANITFTRVGAGNSGDGAYSDSAAMLLGNYTAGQAGASAFAYFPGNPAINSNSGDSWFNYSLPQNVDPPVLSRGHQIMLHELGHAIGLSHPAAYNAQEGLTITYTADATYYEDTRQYTVMSYFSEGFTGATFNGSYPASPMLDDIAAAQRLYGANMTTRTGDTIYGFNSNADRPWYHLITGTSPMVAAIWDAGGVDTLNFVGYFSTQVIDLRQGAFSSVGGLLGNVAIAVGAVIENAVGGQGADTIFGNAADNVITGGGGDDVINGGLGSDTVVFSGARSAYTVTWNGQTATVTGPDGVDTLTNVDFLRFSDQTIAAQPTGGLIVSGDLANNLMEGTAFADTLGGFGGNDTINGQAGNDILSGGSGDDVISGGEGDDVISGGDGNDALSGGGGSDIADYSAATSGVVVDLSTGAASGGAGSDTLNSIEQVRGSTLNDTLTGDGADNILFGQGGADTLRGAAGQDILVAGAPGQAGGAPDIVKPSTTTNGSIGLAISLDQSFDLVERPGVANGTTIPHATVTAVTHGGVEYYAFTVSSGSTVTIDIDGASFDSTLRLFNSAGLTLASNDDAGSDGSGATDSALTYTFTTGGLYYVEVAEWLANASGGTFTTQSPAANSTYTLHVSVPNHAVIPVVIAGSTLDGGDGHDTLYGGNGTDWLIGGNGDDVLVGGESNDLLVGGAGADVFRFTTFFDSHSSASVASDVIDDFQSGVDKIDLIALNLSAITITAEAGFNVVSGQTAQGLFSVRVRGPVVASDVQLVVDQGGSTIMGTAASESLTGSSNNEIIIGLGGADALVGGGGADTFRYTSTSDSNGSGYDNLIDFTSGVDRIDLTALNTTSISLIRSGGSSFLFAGTPTGAFQLVTSGRDINASDILYGNNHGIYLIGSAESDTLIGSALGDPLQGNGGDDVLIGGAGGDAISGGAGADTFRYLATGDSNAAGYDNLYDFESGTDKIDLAALGTTAVSVVRQDGSSFVFANTASGAFQLIAAGRAINGADFVGLSHGVAIAGSSVAEALIGGALADVITGSGGADDLAGGGGSDRFYYAAAADSNAAGFDNLYDFETGSDRIDVAALNTTAISIIRSGGSSFVFADTAGGAFQLVAAGRVINGGDLVYGSHGIYMVGSGDADSLIGGNGADGITGGAGDDTLIGGGGADVLFGDGGVDTFRYLSASESTDASSDRLFTFVSGVDKIDLTAVRTGPSDVFGIAYSGGGSFLFVDLGGNGVNDMVIQLANVTLVASDILWQPATSSEAEGGWAEPVGSPTDFDDFIAMTPGAGGGPQVLADDWHVPVDRLGSVGHGDPMWSDVSFRLIGDVDTFTTEWCF